MESSSPLPTISRVLPDGTLIELLYREEVEATSFAIRTPEAEIRIEPIFMLGGGERLVPYSASNNLIASGCVLLLSEPGRFDDKAALLADLRAFIGRYVDLSSVEEDLAAHYALLSWVGDAFNDMPYLRFQGRFGSGKTRALLVVGSLCYKPFFASGASTVSPIFHILDHVSGTLVLDEADLRFSDATTELAKILNNGSTKGLPVLRTMTNRQRELNPRAFRVFGPKLVAMRAGFDDQALESRFITISTGPRPPRPDIPLSLPETMKSEALALRNRLLAWRFAARHQVAIDHSRAIDGLSPRGNQMALPLLAIVDDENLRHSIGEELIAREQLAEAARSEAIDAALIRVLAEMGRTAGGASYSLKSLTEAYNAERNRGAPVLSVKATGWFVRRKLGLKTQKTRGVYVIPGEERGQIQRLAERFGVASIDSEISGADQTTAPLGQEGEPLLTQ